MASLTTKPSHLDHRRIPAQIATFGWLYYFKGTLPFVHLLALCQPANPLGLRP